MIKIMVIISIVATMGLAIYRRYKKTYIRLYKNKECIYIDGFSLSENEAKDQQNKVGSPEPSSEAIDTYLVRGRNIEHRGMGELFSFIEKDISYKNIEELASYDTLISEDQFDKVLSGELTASDIFEEQITQREQVLRA